VVHGDISETPFNMVGTRRSHARPSPRSAVVGAARNLWRKMLAVSTW